MHNLVDCNSAKCETSSYTMLSWYLMEYTLWHGMYIVVFDRNMVSIGGMSIW